MSAEFCNWGRKFLHIICSQIESENILGKNKLKQIDVV